MACIEPLYIDGPSGRLFLVHHPPATEPRGHCLVVVPPFAEEMNKSRRQMTLLAWKLRTLGHGTVIADLFGTGDSEGAFADASVDAWRADTDAIIEFCRSLGYRSIRLLGIRFGALLIARILSDGPRNIARVIWWQPILNGKTLLNQFLRLKSAAALASGDTNVSVGDLRKTLQGGSAVEVAGYTLSPRMQSEIDALELANMPATTPVEWIEIGSPAPSMSPGRQRSVDALRAGGVKLEVSVCDGEPFWSVVETATAPSAIDRTADILMAAP